MNLKLLHILFPLSCKTICNWFLLISLCGGWSGVERKEKAKKSPSKEKAKEENGQGTCAAQKE